MRGEEDKVAQFIRRARDNEYSDFEIHNYLRQAGVSGDTVRKAHFSSQTKKQSPLSKAGFFLRIFAVGLFLFVASGSIAGYFLFTTSSRGARADVEQELPTIIPALEEEKDQLIAVFRREEGIENVVEIVDQDGNVETTVPIPDEYPGFEVVALMPWSSDNRYLPILLLDYESQAVLLMYDHQTETISGSTEIFNYGDINIRADLMTGSTLISSFGWVNNKEVAFVDLNLSLDDFFGDVDSKKILSSANYLLHVVSVEGERRVYSREEYLDTVSTFPPVVADNLEYRLYDQVILPSGLFKQAVGFVSIPNTVNTRRIFGINEGTIYTFSYDNEIDSFLQRSFRNFQATEGANLTKDTIVSSNPFEITQQDIQTGEVVQLFSVEHVENGFYVGALPMIEQSKVYLFQLTEDLRETAVFYDLQNERILSQVNFNFRNENNFHQADVLENNHLIYIQNSFSTYELLNVFPESGTSVERALPSSIILFDPDTEEETVLCEGKCYSFSIQGSKKIQGIDLLEGFKLVRG